MLTVFVGCAAQAASGPLLLDLTSKTEPLPPQCADVVKRTTLELTGQQGVDAVARGEGFVVQTLAGPVLFGLGPATYSASKPCSGSLRFIDYRWGDRTKPLTMNLAAGPIKSFVLHSANMITISITDVRGKTSTQILSAAPVQVNAGLDRKSFWIWLRYRSDGSQTEHTGSMGGQRVEFIDNIVDSKQGPRLVQSYIPITAQGFPGN